jgi:hypothetical protein
LAPLEMAAYEAALGGGTAIALAVDDAGGS